MINIRVSSFFYGDTSNKDSITYVVYKQICQKCSQKYFCWVQAQKRTSNHTSLGQFVREIAQKNRIL